MDSNLLFDIFKNFQISTKSGPVDPLFIAEVLWKIQETSQVIFKNIIFVNMRTVDIAIFGNGVFRFLKSWSLDVEIVDFEFYYFED